MKHSSQVFKCKGRDTMQRKIAEITGVKHQFVRIEKRKGYVGYYQIRLGGKISEKYYIHNTTVWWRLKLASVTPIFDER